MKRPLLRWVSALLAAAMLMQSTGGLAALAEEAATPETAEASAAPETARTEEKTDLATVPSLLPLRENADGASPDLSAQDSVSFLWRALFSS